MNRQQREAFVKTLKYPVIIFADRDEIYCTLKDEQDAALLIEYASDDLDWSLLPVHNSPAGGKTFV